jgi:hypothetical protein
MKLLDKKNWRWILLLAFIISLIAVLPTTVKALPQRAITLLFFRGTGQNNAVWLEWETSTEFETAGFIIQRANSQSGPYTDLGEIGFVPAEGDGIVGAYYEATDTDNIVNGQTYWYILIELENGGSENATEPIAVSGGVATPTATATNTATTQPTSNSGQATATATQTRTPTPTNTSQPTSQSPNSSSPTSTRPPSQATTQPGSPSQPAATAQTVGSTSSGSGGSNNVAQASSPSTPYPAPGTASPTFVPNPQETIATDPAAYPPGEQEGQPGTIEGYPAATEAIESDVSVTPAIEPQGGGEPRPFSTQPPLDQQDSGDTADQPGSSNTLFLWVGFTAALLVFAGGIIGSIFLFTRRSNQK